MLGKDFLMPGKVFPRPCSSVVEHSLGKGEVARSIRAMGTNEFRIRPVGRIVRQTWRQIQR